MKQYLDDRMYVVCMARFVKEELYNPAVPLIVLGFENIENKRFYTNNGIVTHGEHYLSMTFPIDEKNINSFISQNHSDKYAVLTFENIRGYPPQNYNIYNTKEDTLNYLRFLVGRIPMESLDGKPIDFKNDDEFRDYVFRYNMEEFFENTYLDF